MTVVVPKFNEKAHMRQDWVISLMKEHLGDDEPHRYSGAGKVIDRVHDVLDSRGGKVLHARRLITLLDAGYHPECPLCWQAVRRAWRVWLKYNVSLGFDSQYKYRGMSMTTAKYQRCDNHKYRAVIRDPEDD